MSAFVERLVQQMLKLHQRELELEVENSRLEGKVKRKAELEEKLVALQKQHETVDNVRATLDKLNEETEEKYRQAQKDDEVARKALAEQMRAQIDEVNTRSTEVAAREAKALQQNGSYKKQLEIYPDSPFSDSKYTDLIEARKREFDAFAEKTKAEVARAPSLRVQLEEETKELAELREEHAKVKSGVDGFVARFAEIQEQLNRSKETYESAREVKERQLGRIRSLETDRQLALSRAQGSRKERDKEYEKVRSLEEKVAELKKQIEKITAVTAMLEAKQEQGEEGVDEAKDIEQLESPSEA